MKIMIIVFVLLNYFTQVFSADAAKMKPNILFILADDCAYNELACYGGQNAKTPNIDKLAEEGLLFRKAYVSMAMCTPSRVELFTGMYPLQSGSAWNHSNTKPGTKSIFHYLTDIGYRVGISGKKDVRPREVFPYINVPGFEISCTRPDEKKEDLSGIRRFMEQEGEQPFCLFVCSTSPHAPWTLGDPSAYPPDQLKLPGSLGDTPEVREAYSRYLAELTYFDRQVGEVLRTLEETGEVNNTLVMLSTEQGWQFSGGKWTNWDLGVHSGLIAKWPGKIKPGTETNALVQFADITPTFIEAAGGEKIPGLSGTSFLDVLQDKKHQHREYVYCMHNNVPEGDPYPIRSVISKNFYYIRNLLPDSTYFEKHLEAGVFDEVWWKSWKEAAKEKEQEKQLVERFYRRPKEEFYAEEDSLQMTNLSGDPAHRKEIKRHRKALERWMKEQNDPGIPVDTKAAFQKKYWIAN